MKLKSFVQKFGSHYAIERFGIIFLSLSLAMIILLGTIVARRVDIARESLSGRAIYTTEFTMSLTSTEGSVRGVYVNEDHTKCFLLFKYADVGSLSIDANDYTFYLTGSDTSRTRTDLQSQPNGMFYSFGNTGYMGLYLYNNEPFPSQILELTIRSNNNFVTGAANADAVKDSTFADFNQGLIYFNPGGSYATKAAFLDQSDWSVFDAYEEMISRTEESVARTNLRNNLIEMHKQKLLMAEYSKRLVSEGMTEPVAPMEIAEDKIYAISAKDKTKSHLTWSVEDNAWSDNDSKLWREESCQFYLDTKRVVPKGYQFDWQDGSVQKGYLTKLTGSSDYSDWELYFDEHAEDETADTFSETMAGLKWYYSDGKEYSSDITGDAESSSNQKKVRINEYIATLTKAWQTYYELKTKYQVEDLSNLLHVESNTVDVESMYSVDLNEDGKLLTLW